MKYMIVIAALVILAGVALCVALVLWFNGPTSMTADQLQGQAWMRPDRSLPGERPTRLLAMTDLPPLSPAPTPVDFVVAKEKSTQAGCQAAVLSFSWPALEPSEDRFTIEELNGSILLQEGRFLFLGIQVVNTTVKELPADLQDRPFDDPVVIQRFKSFLDALGPLLKNRVVYLSIGNETDVYLSANPDQWQPYRNFLLESYQHAKSINPNLVVGTTLTDGGAIEPEFQELVEGLDAHFLTYYHGQHGLEGKFKDPAETKTELVTLANKLNDDRPIVFQEIGFPADSTLGSPEGQAQFVAGVFDAWEELGDRVQMINYFMLYDFPESFVQEQLAYYGVPKEQQRLARFIGSLGLHQCDGSPRPAWEIFQQRGQQMGRKEIEKETAED